MRVLVITNDLPPRVGGIQYYVDQLCRGLAAAGDEVTLYGSTSQGAEDHDRTAPYAVLREPTSVLLPTPVVRRRAIQLVRHLRADVVVFGAAFPMGLIGPAIVKHTGVPYVAFTHGLEVTATRMVPGPMMLRRVGSRASVITHVSHWCRSLLEPAFGSNPRHMLLPPAVDPLDYHRGVDGTEVRRRWGIDGGAPLVVCVSRLVERKGQDRLIDSLATWRSNVPGTTLLVVGGGPHRAALEQQAADAGVRDHVIFTGIVDDADLPAHFAAADVFAMPCRERHRGLEVEAFGIVFIQAAAVGVPVVAGGIGGVPDAVRDGTNGVLVDGTDPAAVTDAVGGLLADSGRAAEMGAAGAAWVADGFTWPERTRQLRELLEWAQSDDKASV